MSKYSLENLEQLLYLASCPEEYICVECPVFNRHKLPYQTLSFNNNGLTGHTCKKIINEMLTKEKLDLL